MEPGLLIFKHISLNHGFGITPETELCDIPSCCNTLKICSCPVRFFATNHIHDPIGFHNVNDHLILDLYGHLARGFAGITLTLAFVRDLETFPAEQVDHGIGFLTRELTIVHMS